MIERKDLQRELTREPSVKVSWGVSDPFNQNSRLNFGTQKKGVVFLNIFATRFPADLEDKPIQSRVPFQHSECVGGFEDRRGFRRRQPLLRWPHHPGQPPQKVFRYPHHQILQGHKVILSACSPYFKKILRDNPCRHPVLILNDMDLEVGMKILLPTYLHVPS